MEEVVALRSLPDFRPNERADGLGGGRKEIPPPNPPPLLLVGWLLMVAIRQLSIERAWASWTRCGQRVGEKSDTKGRMYLSIDSSWSDETQDKRTD